MSHRLKLTKKGHDLPQGGFDNTDMSVDGHVRIENGEIFVDVFDPVASALHPGQTYHVDSNAFPLTKKGIRDAQAWIREWGWDVKLVRN